MIFLQRVAVMVAVTISCMYLGNMILGFILMKLEQRKKKRKTSRNFNFTISDLDVKMRTFPIYKRIS